MTWTFEIHPDDPDTGKTFREQIQAEPPTSIWAVGPPPTNDEGEWVVGLHFVAQDGHVRLAEVKIFPDEGRSPERARGRWSGSAETVSDLGVPAALVKNLTLGRMENQVRAALADPKHPAWGPNHDPYPGSEPPDNWLEWDDLTARVGVDTHDTASKRRPGRPPLSDERLAVVAYYYVQALSRSLKIHRHIEGQMREGTEHLPVAQWISRAREREFLTRPPKPGQRGGNLTPKAIAILTHLGYTLLPAKADQDQTSSEDDEKGTSK